VEKVSVFFQENFLFFPLFLFSFFSPSSPFD